MGWKPIYGQRPAPGDSPDLRRILRVPRREAGPETIAAMREIVSAELRLPLDRPCDCESLGFRCITELKDDQAWALFEISVVQGLIGSISVGGGKTGIGLLAPMAIPECERAVMLVPGNVVNQVVNEYRKWAQHWKVPSLVANVNDSTIVPGRPVLHLISYSKISRSNFADYLTLIDPDLFILDECDMIANAQSARGSRLVRQFAAREYPRVCAWSGTLTNSSILDYAHLASVALKDDSPVPHDSEEREVWAGAVDPNPPDGERAPPGALLALCEQGEEVREAYRRRLQDTQGFVTSQQPAHHAELLMHERQLDEDIPTEIQTAIHNVRVKWERPDGEQLTEVSDRVRVARQLAAGFYYRMIFPNGEPHDLVVEWLLRKSLWASEMRSYLSGRTPYLDSQELIESAAERYDTGVPSKPGKPALKCNHYRKWIEIKPLVVPDKEAVWISDYLARDAARWGHEHRGLIWYEYSAFGRKVAEISGLPLHTGGPNAGDKILAERGDRSLVVSRKSHYRGRDGLQHVFGKQLIANPPESKATGGAYIWEQLLGRLHREGQEAKVIHSWVYRHTDEVRHGWDRAHELARYVNTTMGVHQKLLSCRSTW